MKQPVKISRYAKMKATVGQRATRAHRKLMFDYVVCALLFFFMAAFWNSGGRFLFLGALLMFLPQVFTDASRVLDVELVRDRLGMAPPPQGRHSAPAHHGAHPRPKVRTRG